MHPRLRLFLALCVGDFKLAGPTANLVEGWRLLRTHLSIEPAKPIGLYLGCHHDIQTVCHKDGTVVTVMQYNMEGFLQSCVGRYQELAGGTMRMVSVRIPVPE